MGVKRVSKMRKPGRPPLTGKRAWFADLVARGTRPTMAARIVGIAPITAMYWTKGRRVVTASGAVYEYPPVTRANTDPQPEPADYYMSADERVAIADLHNAGAGVRVIARHLGRSPSTISRELRKHSEKGTYQPYRAHDRAQKAKKRPGKGRKLADDDEVRAWVIAQLKIHWPPETIAYEMRIVFPDPARWVCVETIYQAIYHPESSGIPKDVPGKVLRRRRRRRRPHHQSRERRTRSLTDMVSIHDRPAEANDRTVAGHWEGDLITGASNKSAIITLVDRKNRTTLLGYLPGGTHTAEVVTDAVVATMAHLPPELRRSLTWDQGKEMALHKKTSAALDMPVYFADPRSPWQRPSNENTNGLLRDFFPKGTDLTTHTADDLATVQDLVNDRPRKTLGWARPGDLHAADALTAPERAPAATQKIAA